MKLSELATPCLILDRVRLRRNLARMVARVAAHGVALRPHLKTAKSADVATMALADGSRAITVSTYAEARYFLEHGCNDILLAVGFVPSDLPRLDALRQAGARITLLTDDVRVARVLADHARVTPNLAAFRACVEVDCGGRRGGVTPDSADLLAVAQALAEVSGLFAGVLTHAGHSYNCDDVEAIGEVAEAERASVAHAARRLAHAGLRCDMISAGSTPTAVFGQQWDGVTELRPGVYMFGDLDQAGLRTCGVEDIALSVLCAVRGQYPARGQLLVDAGGLALSMDRRANRLLAGTEYGWVCDEAGRILEGWRVVAVSQEHGFVQVPPQADLAAYPAGTRLRVLPNHACMTAAAHDRYYVVDGESDEAIAVWPRVNYW